MPPSPSDQPVPELLCYRTLESSPTIRPGGSRREWMDQTIEHFAYRCTPLVIANATGWELLSPFHIEAEWEGERSRKAIIIRAKGQPERVKRFVCSHFGHGILTFHPGYVFRTNPGWALWIRGCPNTFKPPIVPLEGIVETDWLPFTFTMNWKFTSPGKVIFQKDEPFCFITLTPHGVIDRVTPYVSDLQADPTLMKAYDDWRASRKDFNQGLNDPASIQSQQGWQKRYLTASEAPDISGHRIKRRLLSPQTLEKNDGA